VSLRSRNGAVFYGAGKWAAYSTALVFALFSIFAFLIRMRHAGSARWMIIGTRFEQCGKTEKNLDILLGRPLP
jgi:hypothetical protein